MRTIIHTDGSDDSLNIAIARAAAEQAARRLALLAGALLPVSALSYALGRAHRAK